MLKRLIAAFPNDHTRPRTSLQWAQCGFLVKPDAVGEEMYCNHHWSTAVYFFREDVYEATEEQLAEYWQKRKIEEKKLRAVRQKEQELIRQEKRRIIRSRFASLREYYCKHRSCKDKRVQAVCDAIQRAIRCFLEDSRPVSVYSFFNIVLPDEPLEPVKSEYIVLDMETTGLYPKHGAEILQLSIINQDGDVLFNEYFKPLFSKTWDDAMKVHHITPEAVADKPCIYERLPEILAILRGAGYVVGYNTQFDLSMLDAVGAVLPDETPVVDVMQDFAAIYGAYDEKHGSYRWQKLTVCADYYGYDWGEDASHDSLADCRATLFCYQKTQELPF